MKVVVLPGLDGTGAFVDRFCEVLSASYPTVAIRYPHDLVDYSELQDWLAHVLPAEDYVIVAESFSGPLAIRLASQKTKNLRAVVFVATFAQRPRRVPRWIVRLLDYLPIKSAAFAWLVQPAVMGRWTNRHFIHHFGKALKAVPHATLMGRLRVVSTVDVCANLAETTVPCLYLRARNDWLVPKRASRDFSQVVEIAGPHFLLQARPEISAEQIARFIDRAVSADRAP